MTDGALRQRAKDLFAVACSAADPADGLRSAFARDPLPKAVGEGQVFVLSIGKAAVAMAEQTQAELHPHTCETLVVTTPQNARDLPGAKVIAGGHPVPNEGSVLGFKEAKSLLSRTTENDQVIALISGGGSALFVAPAGDITLADKAEANRLMLEGGLDITSMNLVRQQLSEVKGGGLLRLAAPAPVSSYILSDVIGDDLNAIASGLTTSPLGTAEEAKALLVKTGLWSQFPNSIRVHLDRPFESVPTPTLAKTTLIGSNRISLKAVETAAADLNPIIVNDSLIGDVTDAATYVVDAASKVPEGQMNCLIFGGETTVNVTGTGLGGRNQELALRVARLMPDLKRDWAFLSGGTDGRDGPTDSAGGIVDAGTCARIGKRGGDLDELLDDNYSYAGLKIAGDHLMTGATGTNVADVQILLLGA